MAQITDKKIHQGTNVKIRRTVKNYTQEYLAELIGISQKNLSDIEKQSTIDDEMLNKIAKALDTDVQWFKLNDPDNVGRYNITTITNNSSETSSPTYQGQFGNAETSTIINNSLHEMMKVTEKALAMQRKNFEREMELKEEIFKLKLENILLKQDDVSLKRKK